VGGGGAGGGGGGAEAEVLVLEQQMQLWFAQPAGGDGKGASEVVESGGHSGSPRRERPDRRVTLNWMG
jgi:hypothetical protein